MLEFISGVFFTVTIAFFALSLVTFLRVKKVKSDLYRLTSDVEENRRNIYEYIDSETENLSDFTNELSREIDELKEKK
jgi:hypothetical protein